MKLLLGDCLELMKTLPDESIDMVLADPPYGTTACKWDSVIPFEPMWAELKRITTPRAAIVLFGSEPFSSHLRNSAIDFYKYDWIWVKSKKTGHMQARNAPLKKHEVVSVFSRGTIVNNSPKKMNYFPQGLVPCRKNYRSVINGPGVLGRRETKTRTLEQTNYPTSLLEFKNDLGLHPTQKPVALLEYLIVTYTRPRETVLDFCMGSGSTGVACQNTGRDFIGIEKELKYYDIACRRINGTENREKEASA